MRVSAINQIKLSNKTYEQRQNPNFNAKLVVSSNAYKAVKGGKFKFDRAVEYFRHKLALDLVNPEDTVFLRELTGKAKAIVVDTYEHTPGHYESRGYQQVFVRDKIRTGYGGSIIQDAPTERRAYYENENLEIAINNYKIGFCYNDRRSEEQLGEDMYNAYKHVRYLAHYAGK